jgi:hypothetical protein
MKIISCHHNYESQTFASKSDTWNALCWPVNNFFSAVQRNTQEKAILKIFRDLAHWIAAALH